MKLTLPLIAVFTLLSTTLLAQPELYQGCHWADTHRHRKPLTAREQEIIRISENRSDTVDILHYNIRLNIRNVGIKYLEGRCEVQLSSRMDGIQSLWLDLLKFQVDSVKKGDQTLNYTYDGNQLLVSFPPLNTGDTMTLSVWYQGEPTVDPTGFGGFDFNNGYAYNLGIGLGSNPYNYGRGWYPCIDNFIERATYDITATAPAPNRAYAVGTFLKETIEPSGAITRHYQLSQPIPTYLSGVAISNYREVNYSHKGAFGDIPVQLLAKPADTTAMKSSFQYLGKCIDALEYWFGPYQWERVGYVLTVRGAMEHATNIAYPEFSGVSGPTFSNNKLMAHELAHHWWGNYTTLSSPADMWFKEGNAEYGAHLFTEYTFGKAAFRKQVKDNLLEMIEKAHVNDKGYWPLSGIPYEHTYGTHTYNKGACMMHNMRAYLGDSLYRKVTTDMLQEFAYQSKNASQVEAYLTSRSGIDMKPYFDAWIKAPGWAGYHVQNYSVQNSNNQKTVNIEIHQGLRGTTQYHQSVPLYVYFYKKQQRVYSHKVYVSGPSTTVSVQLPLNVEFTDIWLNDDQELNYAGMGLTDTLTAVSDEMSQVWTDMRVRTQAISQPVTLHIDHLYYAPDPLKTNPNNATISTTHFWQVHGTFDKSFVANGNVEYDGFDPDRLDYLLTNKTEDSVAVWFKANGNDEWALWPYQRKVKIVSNDGRGQIRIDSLQAGFYTFGNGDPGGKITSTSPALSSAEIQVWPNPVHQELWVNLEQLKGQLHLEILDASGKPVLHHSAKGGQKFNVNLPDYLQGNLLLQIRNSNGELIATKKIQKIAGK